MICFTSFSQAWRRDWVGECLSLKHLSRRWSGFEVTYQLSDSYPKLGKGPDLIEGYCTQRFKWPTSLSSGSASYFLLWASWMQSGLFNCKPDRWSRYVFPWMGMKVDPHVPMTQWWQLLLISRDGASRWGVVWMLCIRTGWWVFRKPLNRTQPF